MTVDLKKIGVKEILDAIIGLSDRRDMFSSMPLVVFRGEVMEHLYKFDVTGGTHGPKDITDTDNAHREIQCPIYHENENSKILFNNFKCVCGLLFIFPARVQPADEHVWLEDFSRYGVCPCTACKHWHSMLQCRYGK